MKNGIENNGATGTVRVRKTAEEKLQDLLAQQSSLQAQLKAQQRKISARDALAQRVHIAAIGEAVFAAWGKISLDEVKARLVAAEKAAGKWKEGKSVEPVTGNEPAY